MEWRPKASSCARHSPLLDPERSGNKQVRRPAARARETPRDGVGGSRSVTTDPVLWSYCRRLRPSRVLVCQPRLYAGEQGELEAGNFSLLI